MKKSVLASIIFLLMFLLLQGQVSSYTKTAAETIAAQSNNKEIAVIDASAILVEKGVSYAPVWSVLKVLRLELSFGNSSPLILSDGEKSLTIPLDMGHDVSPKAISKDNNIYIPLKYTADFFGYKIKMGDTWGEPEFPHFKPDPIIAPKASWNNLSNQPFVPSAWQNASQIEPAPDRKSPPPIQPVKEDTGILPVLSGTENSNPEQIEPTQLTPAKSEIPSLPSEVRKDVNAVQNPDNNQKTILEQAKQQPAIEENKSPKNDVQKSHPDPKATPETVGKQTVYLTFDDGPNGSADEKILDILKMKKAKATFFMIEPQIRDHIEIVKRLVSEGHYPALHSVTHNREMLYGGSPLKVAAEMEKTRKTLLEVTGVDSKLTRVPYGSKPYMTEPFRGGLADQGFKMWDWTVDSEDWKYHNSNPGQIVKNVINGVERIKNGKKPIVILLHAKNGTASVLPQIIDYLQKQGYECEAYNPGSHIPVNFWSDERL